MSIPCPFCNADIIASDIYRTAPRKVTLHALHHGSIIVSAIDRICSQCTKLVTFDGGYQGLFSISKFHLLTRELLDVWTWKVCGSGRTFRDAYASWHTESSSPSSVLHIIGNAKKLNRQTANDAFGAFVSTLRFPSDEDLASLFTCSDCEITMGNGERRMDGVVMLLWTEPPWVYSASCLSMKEFRT